MHSNNSNRQRVLYTYTYSALLTAAPYNTSGYDYSTSYTCIYAVPPRLTFSTVFTNFMTGSYSLLILGLTMCTKTRSNTYIVQEYYVALHKHFTLHTHAYNEI